MNPDLKSILNRSSTALIVLGVLGILTGLVVVAWPGITSITFAIIWGVYALVDGISALALAFTQREGRGWLIVSGAIGVLAGILVIALPGTGLATWGWLLGVWLLVRGISEIVAAFAPDNSTTKWIMLLGGVLWIIAGGFAVANPLETAISLTWFFGLMAIAWGATLLITGVLARKTTQPIE